MSTTGTHQKILHSEFERRVKNNSRYSIRSFARLLQMDASSVAQFLSGKRVPSIAVGEKVCERLGLNTKEKNAFLASLGEAKLRAGKKRVSPRLRELARALTPPQALPLARDLTPEVFCVMADWYHAAILELTFVEGFRSEASWIARRLGIPTPTARAAIDRLLELGLLEIEKNRLVKKDDLLETSDRSLTSAAHKNRQKDVLKMSMTSLENDPMALRSHQAMTFAIDPEQMPAAQKRIQIFLRDLCLELESGARKEVYECQVSLFPLTNAKTKQE